MIVPRQYDCVVCGKKLHRVWVGSTFTGGKPAQHYFDQKGDAKDFVKQVLDTYRREGQQAFLLTINQRAQAVKAFQKLALYGVDLPDGVSTYITKHCVSVVGKEVNGVVGDFIKSCRRANLKPRTITQYQTDLSIFSETFGESQLVAGLRDDIEEWLDEFDWSARTRRNKLTTLTTFYTFAIDKGYCSVNPVERIKRPKVDEEPIGILSPDQTQALLEQAVQDRRELVGGIAIAAFAGLRRSELCGSEWEEVHFQAGEIEIKASRAKTRQRRIVSISETLPKWLAIYGLAKGRVTVTSNADVWDKWVCELGSAAGIKAWPKNALRHGFGSFYFALIKDENRVAAEMGNSPEMVRRHYRARCQEIRTRDR